MIKLVDILLLEKIKGIDGKACWKGYKYAGTKDGKDKCVPISNKLEEIIIECSSCPWSWDEKDGGEDMYICHKCGTDNTSKYIKRGEIEENMTISEVLDINIIDGNITEAKYKGKTVTLNKPTRGDSKKFKVYVNSGKKNADGSIKVKKVNFGHGGTSAKRPTMRIRKSNPKRRKAFRARHRCDTPGPKTMARYWSCKKW